MMMYTLCVLFVHALLLDVTLSEYDVHKIHILIVDQSNSYHAGESLKLKDNLLSQAAGLKSRSIVSVEALHQTFPNTSYWTILPILKSVQHAAKIGLVQWVVLVQESSEVKVDKLLTVLASYASDQPVFLGHAVYDEQPTIVHHFAFHENSKEFLYPAGLAGIAFNIHLLEKLFCAGADDPTDIQFSTDPQHELALFIWKHGVNLTHCSSFCVNEGPHCAISPRGSLFTNCGESVKIEDIYFAVKTWSGNYETRLPVLLSTWLQGVDYQLYGDKEDVVLPVVVTGVPNTKTGHCAKTINILKSLLSDPVMTDRQWFVLVDDDTLVNVEVLQDLLGCYSADEALILGEKYGYAVDKDFGYDYITGGGGIVFNRRALQSLFVGGACVCPNVDSPDDMILGMCAKRLGIPLTDSRLFHQARPEDYPLTILKHRPPLSFHSFWNIDAKEVFQVWLTNNSTDIVHSEL